ncbi:hypothetical protein AMK59_7096 [Oryctes borbonicus]|uniref:DUF4604 domain-containing protein n=1 Tax=Oryctes borbonicus TaxID=1629725 RepID=A0A0T6AWL8_9SCAR|nr:hypothetical protein AMK59_7096 [Oryctes borbonicus]
MSKRNVTYIKPEEPAFLKKIKEQVGYTEGPTVNTKRENLNPVEPEDLEDTAEEQPTVVVLQTGDLTAEEAAEVNKQREEAPADLTKPIVFRAKSKNKDEKGEGLLSKNKRPLVAKETKSKKIKASLLSFDQEEEDN